MRRLNWVGLLLVALSCGYPSHAAGPVEIWSWGFVTLKPDEPTAGSGASLFKPVDGWLVAPLHVRDGPTLHVKVALKKDSASAVLTTENGQDITLEGPVTQVRQADGKGCSLHARLSNGSHYLLLQRYLEKCAP
jgi:hypothetical protein